MIRYAVVLAGLLLTIAATSHNATQAQQPSAPVQTIKRTPLQRFAVPGTNYETVIGLAKLSKEIGRQSAMLGYINAFGLYTLASALAIPLVLMVGGRSRAR